MDIVKREIIDELDSRIERLQNHAKDHKETDGNQYEQLNHALSRVIGVSLEQELESLRDFVEEL